MIYNNLMNINELVYDLAKIMHISLAQMARAINQSPQNFNNKLKRGTLSLNELSEIAEALNIDFCLSYDTPYKKISFRNNSIINSDILEFCIFCIEKLKENINISGEEVYELLANQTNILYPYIVKNYEILHTQGEQYIINDLKEVLNERINNL